MRTLTIKLDEETYAACHREAARTGGTAAELAQSVLQWTLGPPAPEDAAALTQALAEADRREFADEAEIEVLWANFGR